MSNSFDDDFPMGDGDGNIKECRNGKGNPQEGSIEVVYNQDEERILLVEFKDDGFSLEYKIYDITNDSRDEISDENIKDEIMSSWLVDEFRNEL